MKLLLVRHGEIPANVNKIYAGRSPEKLTERGMEQAKRASERLKNYSVSAIYSSPIQRAVQTARIIAGSIGMEYKIENEFREMELGPWEGMAENDIAAKYPEEWHMWNTRPADLILTDRETLDSLLSRVLKGLQNIYADGRDRTIVVVTHVAIIRVLLLWHNKKSLNFYKTVHVPNAVLFEIKIEPSDWQLIVGRCPLW